MTSLHDLLRYEPDTGKIFWRVDRGRVRAGDEAGASHPQGYLQVRATIDGYKSAYLSHRLAWFLHYGVWPDGPIDHRNGARTDNRLSNLRKATHSLNAGNGKRRDNNRSGFKGVVQVPSGRYQAHIFTEGRQKYLGTFDHPSDAHTAYVEAAKTVFGEFARGE